MDDQRLRRFWALEGPAESTGDEAALMSGEEVVVVVVGLLAPLLWLLLVRFVFEEDPVVLGEL